MKELKCQARKANCSIERRIKLKVRFPIQSFCRSISGVRARKLSGSIVDTEGGHLVTVDRLRTLSALIILHLERTTCGLTTGSRFSL
jgi:hypothetical protein